MIVVGFDVGATTGVTELEIGGSPVTGMTAHWRCGMSFRVHAGLVEVLRSLCQDADLVAIEQVSGFPHGKDNFVRAKALIETAKVGERIATIVRDVLRKPVATMTAGRARQLIVGRNNPDDATVKVAVQRLIRGVPKRTNAHVRDAAVVALACAWSKPNLRSAG